MAGNSGGPWGGGGNSGGSGGNNGGDDKRGNNGGGRRPGQEGPQIPEIDELVKKGQEQLRVLMGGRGGDKGRGGGTGGGGGGGPRSRAARWALPFWRAAVLWGMASFYTVKPEEQSVELFLGKEYAIGNPGLNFAPWPVVTAEVIPVSSERTEDIGVGARGDDAGSDADRR